MSSRWPRIDHGGAVQVVAPSVSWTGRAVNLSIGGAFISGGPPLEVGRRVSLSIDLGDGKPPVGAHARVTWLQAADCSGKEAGIGVRFVRIDEGARRRIDRLVIAHTHASRGVFHGPVRVRLPGLAGPLRCNAHQVTPRLLILDADIGWLQIGSTISAELSSGSQRTGRLAWVGTEATTAGHARLSLHLEVSEDDETVVERVAEPEASSLSNLG
jgi:Tfp pilus assembly protein PilZ